MIKIGDDYSDYTNIEKNEFSNELAKLQLQIRWENEIDRESDRKENTQRERERKERGRYSLLLSETSADPRCFSMAAFFSRSPWYATFDMCFVFCLMRNVSGSSATCRHMNEEACVWERGREQKGAGHTDLCKFAFGLLEIRMVFYIRLNFRILSNALQFGCIGNCCCLGLGYVSARRKETEEEEANEKREKSKKMSTRKSSSCRRVVFRHSAFPCSMLCMWHVVAYCCCCCCCPKTDFATVAAPPTLRCPQGTTAHHWPQLMERMNSPCFPPLLPSPPLFCFSFRCEKNLWPPSGSFIN